MRVAAAPEEGVAVVAEVGPRLPFRDGSIDELFVGRAVSHRSDIASTLEELWRVCKPGGLVHMRLPHASSALAVTRDPRGHALLTLETFNYYDPRLRPAGSPARPAFLIERARLCVKGPRSNDASASVVRGPLARVIEQLANSNRGTQYRFERWLAHFFGGFEELSIVLLVVKQSTQSDWWSSLADEMPSR
jgi:SAM-dependent methyltransferase